MKRLLIKIIFILLVFNEIGFCQTDATEEYFPEEEYDPLNPPQGLVVDETFEQKFNNLINTNSSLGPQKGEIPDLSKYHKVFYVHPEGSFDPSAKGDMENPLARCSMIVGLMPYSAAQAVNDQIRITGNSNNHCSLRTFTLRESRFNLIKREYRVRVDGMAYDQRRVIYNSHDLPRPDGRWAVLVAGGDYSVMPEEMLQNDIAYGDHITALPFIDYYGGFNPENWNSRNIQRYKTIIGHRVSYDPLSPEYKDYFYHSHDISRNLMAVNSLIDGFVIYGTISVSLDNKFGKTTMLSEIKGMETSPGAVPLYFPESHASGGVFPEDINEKMYKEPIHGEVRPATQPIKRPKFILKENWKDYVEPAVISNCQVLGPETDEINTDTYEPGSSGTYRLGGIFAGANHNVHIKNCIISGHTRGVHLGLVHNSTIENCIITDNHLTEQRQRHFNGAIGGSGIAIDECRGIIIKNNIIAKNTIGQVYPITFNPNNIPLMAREYPIQSISSEVIPDPTPVDLFKKQPYRAIGNRYITDQYGWGGKLDTPDHNAYTWGSFTIDDYQYNSMYVGEKSIDGRTFNKYAGAGISWVSSEGIIYNNIIFKNKAFNTYEVLKKGSLGYRYCSEEDILGGTCTDQIPSGFGGGIYVLSGAKTFITNNTIAHNEASMYGPGIAYIIPEPTHVIQMYQTWAKDPNFWWKFIDPLEPPFVANNIIWGNDSPGGFQVYPFWPNALYDKKKINNLLNIYDPIESTTIEYYGKKNFEIYNSNIQYGFYGTNNLNVDPEFKDWMFDDYHIQRWSPCIDRGIGSGLAWYVPEKDIEGDERMGYEYGDNAYDECDIGADEWSIGTPTPTPIGWKPTPTVTPTMTPTPRGIYGLFPVGYEKTIIEPEFNRQRGSKVSKGDIENVFFYNKQMDAPIILEDGKKLRIRISGRSQIHRGDLRIIAVFLTYERMVH